MRALIVTSTVPSHLTAMIPLAWALRASGHQVRVACQPDQVAAVRSVGLPAVPLGEDTGFAQRHRESVDGTPGQPYYREKNSLVDQFAAVSEEIADDLAVVAAVWKPDLIVQDPLTFAGEIVAAANGIPSLRHLWGPDIFGTVQGKWLAGAVRERLLPIADRLGAPAPPWSEWVIDPTPPRMRPAEPGAGEHLAVRYVPADIPGTVPLWAFEPSGKPRVCVTWGTFSEGLPDKNLVPDIVTELSKLDIEQVVAIKESERHLVGEVPDSVRVVSGLPLHAVLPTCSAVVFHGGGNTMLGSMLEGVPALAISANFERRFNTGYMVQAGAGLLLDPDTLQPGEIADAVRALLEDPAHRAAAEAVRDEMLALPTPAELVSTLEDIAAGRRVPEKEGVSR